MQKETAMYALIYDDHELDHPKKRVISVHDSREESDRALKNRWDTMGKRVWECNTRIVWVDREVNPGDMVTPGEFHTWRPGEPIPRGDRIEECD